MNHAFVDVVMTSYNKGPYIGVALDSIFAQKTDKIDQIYICDDGSTDNTIEVIREYQIKHPGKIKLIQNKTNIGVCRNTRLSLSQGINPFVAPLDADDYWNNENRIELLVNALIENPELIACYNNCYKINETGEVTNNDKYDNARKYFPNKFTKISMQDLYNTPILMDIPFHGNFLVFRRETINQIFTPKFVQIYDNLGTGDSFCYGLFSLMEKGKVLGYFSERMSTWRFNETSKSSYFKPLLLATDRMVTFAQIRTVFKDSIPINHMCTINFYWHYNFLKDYIAQARLDGNEIVIKESYDHLMRANNKELFDLIDYARLYNESYQVTLKRDIQRYGFFGCVKYRMSKSLNHAIIKFYDTKLGRIAYHSNLFIKNRMKQLLAKQE